jgi:hypothetical protein
MVICGFYSLGRKSITHIYHLWFGHSTLLNGFYLVDARKAFIGNVYIEYLVQLCAIVSDFNNAQEITLIQLSKKLKIGM